MNWTMMTVIAAIALLVPLALVALFSSAKDTHQYAQHYNESGYSQELQTSDDRSSDHEAFAPEISGEHKDPHCEFDPPVVEWPSEL